MKRKFAERGRQEPTLSTSVQQRCSLPMDVAASVEHDQQFEMISRAFQFRAGRDFPALGREITASSEQSFFDALPREGYAWNFSAARTAKFHHFECFLDVQLAKLATCIYAPVIINAIGQV